MLRVKELRQRRADLRKEADAILEKAHKEGRPDLSAEEETAFNAILAKIASTDAMLEREEKIAATEKDLPAAVDPSAEALRVEVGADRAGGKPWRGFGEFASAVKTAMTPGKAVDPRLAIQAAATGMSQGVPSEGGFLVPPTFSKIIWDGLNAAPSALLPLTDVYTVEGESLTFNANAETSRAIGSLYGGVQAYWLAEAAQMTGSKPKFRQAKIEPHGLAVMIFVTDKLLNNADTALGQYLTRAATESITHQVNQAIISGTGAGQPKGLLNSGAAVSVAKETNQAAATILQENVSKMWSRLHPSARANAVWLHNTDVEPALDTLSTVVKNVAGSENVGGYANKVFDAERRTLKGRPLMPCEWCETLGTVGDLILVDLKSYLAGVRGSVRSDMSMHLRFDYNETAFRFLYEVDGQCWLASALTPAKGSNTLSTVVTLATRA